MLGFTKYNYDTFTREILAKQVARSRFFGGPEPGDRAPDFQARALDGKTIRLSDYRGSKNVVLTLGSATCPMTTGSIGGMNDLRQDYTGKDVEFLFVYVREAHPGDDLPAHRSLEAKTRAAGLLRAEEGIEMPVLVDDLRGSIHRKYGKLPNPTFLIDKSGRVAFRAQWTQPGIIEDAIEELLGRQRERGLEHAVVRGGEDRSQPMTYAMVYARRALRRGGRKSRRNFGRALGMPGRLALATSRLAEPVALHPGRALAAAAIAGGVITAGLLAGRELRRRRLAPRQPHEVYESMPPSKMTGTDSEPVGI